MGRKHAPIMVLAFLTLMILPSLVQAASITACVLDRSTYHQGETGYIRVTIYNDKDEKIRVTELTATVDYYYSDGIMYVQKFYSDADLPIEIQPGNSDSLDIPFSLPTNVASGYTDVSVKAETELWISPAQRWFPSEHPSYQVTLYVESPYVQWYEHQLDANDALQGQLDEQLNINENTTNMMYLFGFTTLVFAAVAGFLYYILNRRAGFIGKPIA